MNPYIIIMIAVAFFILGKLSSDSRTKDFWNLLGMPVIVVLSILLAHEVF